MDNMYLYTKDYFTEILEQFQKAVDKKEYTERIPYATWRLLKKPNFISVCVKNAIVIIYDNDTNEKLYTDKIYDNGFGRFFYDTVIKKEQEKNMSMTNGITFDVDLSMADTANTSTTYTTNTTSNGWWNGNFQDNWNTVNTTTYATKDELEKIQKTFNEYINNNNKENEKMKGFNFDFGPCNSSSVHMSMYGIAIKNKAGEWVSYNTTSGEIINVDIFNIDNMTKFIYKMPVASNAVEVGDVIIHNGYPMFVQAIGEEFKSFDVVDVYAGESKTVIPTKNMFGFDIMTKVVSLFDATAMAPTADQPFGNMLPFLMMGDGKIDPMAMMLMMNQNGGSNLFDNPMMMYFMMKDNKDIDPMMMMLMMNQTQPHICQCGKH